MTAYDNGSLFTVQCSKVDVAMTGYLQHKASPVGPFRTEAVIVRHDYADNYSARFEGKWRRIHVQLKRLYIVFQGERITIQVEGL